MKKIKIIIAVLSFSAILTALTLGHQSTSERQVVDPDFPEYKSESVRSWGWPLPFVVDNPRKNNMGNIGIGDRIFFGPLFVDLFLIFITLLLLAGMMNVLRNCCCKFKKQ